jgi:hypothetical protein
MIMASDAELKQKSEEPLYGMDYGVSPRYMLMANPALMELWNQAKCIGLGYLILPKFGLFVDVPCVGIMFEDIEKGIRIFKLLQSWDCEPGTGRGTDISFIENQKANSYTMTLSPNTPEMIRRMVGLSMQEDYSVITIGPTIGKTINLSENFHWLRGQPRNKPIVFAPGNKIAIAPIENALAKIDVQFFDVANLPKNTIEFAMSSGVEESNPLKDLEPASINPVEIAAKRNRQLKRFFPIALARLKYNPTFIQITKQLHSRYERWQLVQAACNIICNERFPNFRNKDGKLDFHIVYNELRQSPEKIGDEIPLRMEFRPEAIEAQVTQDMAYLLDRLCPNSKGGHAVPILQTLGLLP